jgi:uncharacterized protein YyaL (SSP411 family)
MLALWMSLWLGPGCGQAPPATVQALPGAPPRAADLDASLWRAADERQDDPATRARAHDADGRPRFVNRLALETSPYLLQHAHNPVDWYAWGDEAFERARAEGKPVFLSIGYSTCHWCHVMERESFEDEGIAAFLNEHFVAIKVDREERPDVDEVYMAAVQAMTGRGGWPMTLVLTPDREPFFATTYVPPRDGDRGAEVGLLTLLQRISTDWAEDPERARSEATRLSAHLKLLARPQAARGVPTLQATHDLYLALRRGYDADNGGFGRSPKFPRPAAPTFLLRYGVRIGEPTAVDMVQSMLARMAAGGIHDQLAGGFHRYSVDRAWRVPHFEKMLYDNAQLALLYTEGWQVTGDPELAAVARRTLDALQSSAWMLPEGGLASATDADSAAPDGTLEEGRFFTWTPDELRAALPAADAELAAAVWGVTSVGPVEGRSVLTRALSPAEAATSLGQDPDAAPARVEALRAALLRVRAARPAPLRDDKVITAWNGLAVSALARAGFALDEPDRIAAAGRTATFLLAELRSEDGTLQRTWRQDRARHRGTLDDHAFLVAGLLDLHEVTADPRWLRAALELQAAQDAGFTAPDGSWYQTADDAEALLTRSSPATDGALPSGNAIAIDNVLRLAAWTGDDAWVARADRALAALGGTLGRGAAAPGLGSALLHRLDGTRQVLVVHDPGDDPGALVDVLRRRLWPHHIRLVATTDAVTAHADLAPWLSGKVPRDGPTAYVCDLGVCQAPTTEPEVLAAQLQERPPLR